MINQWSSIIKWFPGTASITLVIAAIFEVEQLAFINDIAVCLEIVLVSAYS
jgi:hypothetical protein